MMLKAEGPLRTPAKPLHSESLHSLLGEALMPLALCIRIASKAVLGGVPEEHRTHVSIGKVD